MKTQMKTKPTSRPTRARPEQSDPSFVAAATKRVMRLVEKKLPDHLALPEAEIAAAAGPRIVHRKTTTTIGGRYERGTMVYAGDLRIDGSLDLGGVCVVLGDLEVAGVIEALHDESALVVGGSIRARGINCTDHVHAAGSITAEVVFVELEGKLTGQRGIAADLVILEDKSVKLDGKLTAKDKVVLTYPDARGLDQLRAILAPQAFGVVGEAEYDKHLFDYTNLFATLRRGKPWRGTPTRPRGRRR